MMRQPCDAKLRRFLLFVTLGASFAASACAGRSDSPTQPTRPASSLTVTPVSGPLAERLELLEKRLEEARVANHVPGLAIAVVKGDKLIFAKGMGHADVDAKKPATPETLFAVGSTTKAFTAVLAGMMIDEGKLAWDEPIVKRVPEFALPLRTSDKSAVLTLRDTLSHRSGFTRMSLLWVGGNVPRNQMLATAAKAEPWAEYGKKFLYNNVTYAAAGEASARAFGGAWKDLLQKKLLDPLHMTQSNVSIDEIKNDPRLAKGYIWKEEENELQQLPMRNLDAIRPAGGINSNVLDMAQWLRFQLGNGNFEGNQLIQPDTLAETWTPQITVGPNVEYGLGWFLRKWNGKRVVEHGGNIDGFSAQVAMIPEEKLGFVLLTNTSVSPLQSGSRNIVWSSLLGEVPAGDEKSEDFSPYIGVYIADFGPFKDARFRVTEENGKLFVDVPTQMNFELAPAKANGHRPFAVTNTVEVSFPKPEGGPVNSMNMHQGGMTFEMFREGFKPKPEIALAELERYLGSYANEKVGVATVLIRNNRLAVDIPKQTTFELHPPNDAKRWVFRATSDIELSFSEDGQTVTGLNVYRAGQTHEFKRTEAKETVALPSVDALAQLRKSSSFESAASKVGILEFRGTISARQAGINGEVTLYMAGDGRFAVDVDFGPYGRIRDVVHGDGAWSKASFSPTNELKGKYLLQAQMGHPTVLHRDWRTMFDSVRVSSVDKLDGREIYMVALDRGELPKAVAKVDGQTGDVLEIKQVRLQPVVGAIPTTIKFGDYREVFGMRLPMRAETSNLFEGTMVMELNSPTEYEGAPEAVFPKAP